jgi:hypothetical protein
MGHVEVVTTSQRLDRAQLWSMASWMSTSANGSR